MSGVLRKAIPSVGFDVVDLISAKLSPKDLVNVALTAKPDPGVQAKLEVIVKMRQKEYECEDIPLEIDALRTPLQQSKKDASFMNNIDVYNFKLNDNTSVT